MGTNTHHKPQHAAVWSIISEDEADRRRNGHAPKHVRTGLMDGCKIAEPIR